MLPQMTSTNRQQVVSESDSETDLEGLSPSNVRHQVVLNSDGQLEIVPTGEIQGRPVMTCIAKDGFFGCGYLWDVRDRVAPADMEEYWRCLIALAEQSGFQAVLLLFSSNSDWSDEDRKAWLQNFEDLHQNSGRSLLLLSGIISRKESVGSILAEPQIISMVDRLFMSVENWLYRRSANESKDEFEDYTLPGYKELLERVAINEYSGHNRPRIDPAAPLLLGGDYSRSWRVGPNQYPTLIIATRQKELEIRLPRGETNSYSLTTFFRTVVTEAVSALFRSADNQRTMEAACEAVIKNAGYALTKTEQGFLPGKERCLYTRLRTSADTGHSSERAPNYHSSPGVSQSAMSDGVALRQEPRIPARVKQQLLDALANQRLCLIVGSGVPLNATRDEKDQVLPYLTWKGLLQHGLRYVHDLTQDEKTHTQCRKKFEAIEAGDDNADLEAAQYIRDQLHNEYRDWLETVFKRLSDKVTDNRVLRVIKALCNKRALLMTTNYDHLLENLARRGITLNPSDLHEVRSFVNGERLSDDWYLDVYHIHGDYTHPQSLVLDFMQYQRAVNDDEVTGVLRNILQTKNVLFIGCGLHGGLEDRHFAPMWKWLERNVQQRRHVCLIPPLRSAESLPQHPSMHCLEYGKDFNNDLGYYLQQLFNLSDRECGGSVHPSLGPRVGPIP